MDIVSGCLASRRWPIAEAQGPPRGASHRPTSSCFKRGFQQHMQLQRSGGLEWCELAERDGRAGNRAAGKRGTAHPRHILARDQIDDERKRDRRGEGVSDDADPAHLYQPGDLFGRRCGEMRAVSQKQDLIICNELSARPLLAIRPREDGSHDHAQGQIGLSGARRAAQHYAVTAYRNACGMHKRRAGICLRGRLWWRLARAGHLIRPWAGG